MNMGNSGQPRESTWHVLHTVQGPAGVTGYQIGGPATFLVYGDECDGLMALLAGVRVADAQEGFERTNTPMSSMDATGTPPHVRIVGEDI